MKEHKDNIEEKIKELEDKFPEFYLWNIDEYVVAKPHIKKFLRSALTETYAQARREAVEECVDMVDKMNNFHLAKFDNMNRYSWNLAMEEASGKMNALCAALEKLKDPKPEKLKGE